MRCTLAWLLVALLPCVTTLAACRSGSTPEQVAEGDDPIAALAVTAESRRYTEGYWREQTRAADAGDRAAADRFARAVAYCGDVRPRPGLEADGAKPNCRGVFAASYFRHEAASMRELRARVEAADAQRRRMARDPAYAKRVSDSVYNANKF